MRKSVDKHIRITAAENEDWKRKAELTCMTESAMIRMLMKGFVPKSQPDERFYEYMNQLASISNNINQLVRKANALNFIDAPILNKEVEAWRNFRAELERRFLYPDKSEIKWQ